MKRLFISDLDGTLLMPDAKLSDYTRRELSALIDEGVNFIVATARTASTVEHIMHGINFTLPLVLMSGVLVYDLTNQKYEKIAVIQRAALHDALKAIRSHEISGFLYTIENGEMFTYYENLDSPQRLKFHNERVELYGKRFIKRSFYDTPDGVIYFSTSGAYDTLMPLYGTLSELGTLNVEFYRDIYNRDEWYLEISDVIATKGEAAVYIKERYGFEHIVAFGDNLNDLPLFAVSDENYAVSNAHDDIKRMAGAVIESNERDGVVKQIRKILSY